MSLCIYRTQNKSILFHKIGVYSCKKEAFTLLQLLSASDDRVCYNMSLCGYREYRRRDGATWCVNDAAINYGKSGDTRSHTFWWNAGMRAAVLLKAGTRVAIELTHHFCKAIKNKISHEKVLTEWLPPFIDNIKMKKKKKIIRLCRIVIMISAILCIGSTKKCFQICAGDTTDIGSVGRRRGAVCRQTLALRIYALH